MYNADQWHRLTSIDTNHMSAICSQCGSVSIRQSGYKRDNTPRYKCNVYVMQRIKQQEDSRKGSGYRDQSYRGTHRVALKDRLKLMQCERCAYIAEDVCQLDVDHIVRRSKGGSDMVDNLCILCSNCHRLKSKLEKRDNWNYDSFMAR